MHSIVLVGTGNVAWHLFNAIRAQEGFGISRVVGRNKAALKAFGEHVKTSSSFSSIPESDIYIFAISDDSISSVFQHFKNKKGVFIHTSGSTDIKVFSGAHRKGVLYPLQTFSKDTPVVFKEVPICIEAGNGKDLKLIKKLAEAISDHVYEVSTSQRLLLHLAAVFANNFTNHMYHLAKILCDQHGLPFELLKPLILETANKVMVLTPEQAQTGPARRGDKHILERHLALLEAPMIRDLYERISESIQEKS